MKKLFIYGIDFKMDDYNDTVIQGKDILKQLVEQGHISDRKGWDVKKVANRFVINDKFGFNRFILYDHKRDKSEDNLSDDLSTKEAVSGAVDNSKLKTQHSTLITELSALEAMSGAVVISVDNDEKVRKYDLSAKQAEIIIPVIKKLEISPYEVLNGLPVYKLNLEQTATIMPKFEELGIMETITEDNSQLIINNSQLPDEENPVPQAEIPVPPKNNLTPDTPTQISQAATDESSTQLEGLADTDPAIKKANEINSAIKRLYNSLKDKEEPYYYMALSKEWKRKGRDYISYYNPEWKKRKPSADASNPAVSSAQESTVAHWLRKHFGISFFKFKKAPEAEANKVLSKKEPGIVKKSVREVPKKEEVTKKEPEKIEKEFVKEIEKEEIPPVEVIKPEIPLKPVLESKDSDAELLAKILARVENL